QEWIALTEYGLRYHPDVVIQEIFPLNDICNDFLPFFDACKSRNDPLRPYFVDSGGELELTSAQPFRNWLRRRLASYRVVERRLARGKEEEDPEAHYQRRARDLGLAPLGPLVAVYSVAEGEQGRLMSPAWRHAEAILAKTARAVSD